ncbi:MAG: S8 family peptidase [Deltaproteobacteria bacterium]
MLIIDSGIISNHPLLEKCVGDERNFQNGETAIHYTVGHGTAIAGCAVYGDIERCISQNLFEASNWVFSAKVLYGKRNDIDGTMSAVYDPEKLVEHQLKEAVDSFLSNAEYHIRVINISLGNRLEVWHKHYYRQLPLAALIDEIAYTYPAVTFILSAGNQNPRDVFGSIGEITDNYPNYLIGNDNFKIINPATSALALTVGSIAPAIRQQTPRYGDEQIKTPIAQPDQPSPFTRRGPGINEMVKPELVEYGGNLILFDNYGRITEDVGGKVALLNNQTTGDLIQFDYGTSFCASKVAHIAGMVANKYPQKSANFIANMLLVGADYPFVPKIFEHEQEIELYNALRAIIQTRARIR